MTEKTPIPKGALFIVTTGSYSDYMVVSLCRALEEIDVQTLWKAWVAKRPLKPSEVGYSCTAMDEFRTWLLVESGLVEEQEFREFHAARDLEYPEAYRTVWRQQAEAKEAERMRIEALLTPEELAKLKRFSTSL